MNNTYIDTEKMQGQPLALEKEIITDLANQLLQFSANNAEITLFNMRNYADALEILEENINDNFITLNFNNMGTWEKVEENEVE